MNAINWPPFKFEMAGNRLLLFSVLNYSGVIYTSAIILSIAGVNVFHTCPALYGREACFWPLIFALVILVEILANLVLFHYYNPRNQVKYWTVKSSSLLPDSEAERITQFDEPVDEGDERSRLLGSDGAQSASSPASGRLVITQDGIYQREQWVPDDRPKGTTKFCSECRKLTPRRCHHCPLCEICVLRKDHHCMLTGGCVGLANQRFFIAFLLWASIGAAYGASFTFAYLNRFVSPWYPFGWVQYLAPVSLANWLLGHDSFGNFLLAILFSAAAASSVAAIGFFGVQIFYTANGYTHHDYHVGRLRDELESDGENFGERMALVFGRRWWLNFVFPQVWNSNQLTPDIARNIFLSVSKDL
ncbi:Lethal (2) 35Be [Aphelenchoides fujianensis]|nr:Lethal (2) 35Be [Aphelenchoides fujianensis]